jgi:hypothetical protein
MILSYAFCFASCVTWEEYALSGKECGTRYLNRIMKSFEIILT